MTRVHTLKAMVEEVLRNEPDTRNSDILLTHRIWKRFYPTKIRTGVSGEEGVWLKDMYDLPREDNVKRVRAHFQNDLKKYLPTSREIALQRGFNELEWHRNLGYAQPRASEL